MHPHLNRLLSPRAPYADAFGAHGRTADAVASLIASEATGRIVVLVGPHGSGKSVTVNLVFERVRRQTQHVVPVLFDAWAHRGDVLRRSILDALLAVDSPASHTDTWAALKEELRGKKEVTTSTSAVTLTAGLLALVAVTARVAYGFWDTEPSAGPSKEVALVAAALCGLSAVVLLALAIHRLARDGWRSAVLTLATRTESRELKVTAPDLSSASFSALFSRATRALSESGSTVVLVLDNLDRLDGDDAREVWSTMRSFVRDTERWSDFDRVWVIIPIAPTDELDSLYGLITERVADIVLRLPSPIPSALRRYLQERIHEAFPTRTLPEIDLAVDVVEFLEAGERLPRRVDRLVNDLVTSVRGWPGADYPLAYHAAALLGGDPDTSTPAQRYALDRLLGGDGWVRSVAAIYHGIDESSARELTFLQALRDSFHQGHDAMLACWAELHPTMEVSVRALVRQVAEAASVHELDRIAAAVLPFFDSPSRPAFVEEFASLALDILASGRAWGAPDSVTADAGEGIGRLLAWALMEGRPEAARAVVQVSRRPPEGVPGYAVAQAVRMAVRIAGLRLLLNIAPEGVPLHVPPSEFVAIAALSRGGSSVRALRPDVQAGPIEPAIAEGALQAVEPEAVIHALAETLWPWRWRTVVDTLEDAAVLGRRDPHALMRALTALLACWHVAPDLVQPAVERLATQRSFSDVEQRPETLLLLLLAQSRPNVTMTFEHFCDAPSPRSDHYDVARLASRFQTVEALREVSRASGVAQSVRRAASLCVSVLAGGVDLDVEVVGKRGV